MPKKTLGSTVRRARIRARLGLRELARRIQKTPSYLSDIENNRRVPSEEVLGDLARELPIELEELMALAGRFGEHAERYLQQMPAAAALFRKIAASRLSEKELGELSQRADQLGKKRGKAR